MKSTLRKNPELFMIEEEDSQDSYFLYVPLSGSVARVSGGAINLIWNVENGWEFPASEIGVVNKLEKQRFLVTQKFVDEFEKNRVPERDGDYKPTSVTLMPTFDCNLKCVYCYSKGGEDIGQDLSPEVARASIDLIVGNAKEQGKERVHLGFHGGGEPFYPRTMPLVRDSVSYFKQKAEEED